MAKISTRLICLLMALAAILSSFGIAAYAAEDTDESSVTPRYSVISTNTSRLSISGIKASCSASLTSQYSTSLSIKMELQKKKSSGYETVKTWTASKTGVSLAIGETRNINILYTYRLKTTFTAGSETVTYYAYDS